ncbi:SDR family NAD(P)-dependent oxidoreductase [Marinivivus vitaminiproducens]|uniref:SDR family NAD(P)-dependent oxidoreductase n=1 Tax=Marinivivus vitaminiproducens TaxID=3035935 RepID=UPI002797CE77|nr:SDR family NAD(P)-dependent oxidoreductase [Geminicoccaceae bacterium SCSIO 64248]
MIDFNGRIALVTGAGRGLGFAYARALAERGATVLVQDVGADRSGSGVDRRVAEQAAQALRDDGLSAFGVSDPIATRDDCRYIVDAAVAGHGRLDILIHNAGWVAYETIEAIRESSFDDMMTIAAKAPLWLAQAAWPAMKGNGYGRIVLTTSDRAIFPQYVQPGLIAYAAAKMAAVGIVNVLAHEGEADGIVVNAVSPVAKTRMWGVEGEPDELRPSEVAPGVAFLASDACREGGWILRAANGQFHATRACEAEGADGSRNLAAVRAADVDAVAAGWPRIAVRAVEPRG